MHASLAELNGRAAISYFDWTNTDLRFAADLPGSPPTATQSPTPSRTPSPTRTPSATRTPTVTRTPTASETASATLPPTATPTATARLSRGFLPVLLQP
jgi:hypothetical protein